jgi:hypothetical protein
MLPRRASADQGRSRDRHIGSKELFWLAFRDTDPMPQVGRLPDVPAPEQAITTAGLRLQQAAVSAERLPNGGYMKLERVFLDDRARPYVLHQAVLADELATGPNQNLEDLECAAPNRNRDASGSQLAPGEIDLPSIRRVNGSWALLCHVGGPRGFTNPQNFSALAQGIHARNQLKRWSWR